MSILGHILDFSEAIWRQRNWNLDVERVVRAVLLSTQIMLVVLKIS